MVVTKFFEMEVWVRTMKKRSETLELCEGKKKFRGLEKSVVARVIFFPFFNPY